MDNVQRVLKCLTEWKAAAVSHGPQRVGDHPLQGGGTKSESEASRGQPGLERSVVGTRRTYHFLKINQIVNEGLVALVGEGHV